MNFSEWKYGKVPIDWEVVKLNEIVDVIDSLHKSPQYVKFGYPMIRVKDLYEGYFNIIEPVYVTKEVYEEFSKKHKPQYGDILFSRVGSYGITSFVNTNREFCLGQNTVVITNFNEKIDNKFLFYNMISTNVKNQIEALVTGSTQKTISLKSIRGFDITLPKMVEQKAISNILTVLDEKIEANKQINKKLEEMAQTIFKHWFVDFEFPNEKGESYKSSGGEMVESELGMIPKGWEILNLDKISTLTMGVSPKSDSYNYENIGLPLINGASDFEGKIIKPSKFTSAPKKVCEKGAMIFGVRATIGNIVFADKVYALGRGVASLQPIDLVFRELIYFSLNNSMNNLINNASGSVFLNLKKSDISSLKIICSQSIVNKFNSITSPIIDLIIKNDIESEKLKLVRDTLLPKLMSGEIRVPIDN